MSLDPIILSRITKPRYCENIVTCHYEEKTHLTRCPECGSPLITRIYVPDSTTTGPWMVEVPKASLEMEQFYIEMRKSLFHKV